MLRFRVSRSLVLEFRGLMRVTSVEIEDDVNEEKTGLGRVQDLDGLQLGFNAGYQC